MFVSFLYLIFYFVFTILAQIVRRHCALAELRHRKSTCYDYDYDYDYDTSARMSLVGI